MNFDLEYGLPLHIQEIKSVADPEGGEQRVVEGYVAAFANVDLGGDVIAPGAFDKTLAAGHKVRFLRQHDHAKVLGTVLGLKADAHGLHGRFKISRTPLGEETYQLLKDGALDSFSIGYLTEDSEQKDGGVRELKQVSLLETSVVSVPMNPRALVTAVKGHPNGAADVPFDDLWQRLRDAFVSLEAGVTEAKALYDRRRADGREPSDRHRLALSRTLEQAEATLTGLRSLATAPAKAEAPAAPAEARVDGLRLRLELARRRLQAAGVLERPA